MGALEILRLYRHGLLAGLGVTLELGLIVWTAGLTAGTALGVLAARFQSAFGIPMRILSFLVLSVPVIVLLFWAHYPLQIMLGIAVDPFYTTAATLSFLNALAVAEIIRPAIQAFPAGYIATGRVAGMSESEILWGIQLPVIVRQVLPALLSLQVIALQATIFGALISVDEIFRVSQQIVAATYRPVQVYTALAVLFLFLCLPLNLLALLARHWLREHLSVE